MIEVTTRLELDGGVLVGHDGSAAAAEAVRWAARLAGRLGSPLHVVRTWSISSAPRPATAAPGYVPPMTDFETAVLDRLRGDVEGLALTGELEVHCHVLHGAAGRRLLEASEGAEMLVVGTRGEGGFRGLLFGSTADQVVRHATRPVVVVPVTGNDQPADPDLQLGVRQ
jgi:nucleotide-binding universal stress UspA family protein